MILRYDKKFQPTILFIILLQSLGRENTENTSYISKINVSYAIEINIF